MAGAEKRKSRIVDVAMRLARTRGFESVGLREVAEGAGVALGTLYKSFASKEQIVAAAVEQQTRRLRRQFERQPAAGATRAERVEDLFTRLTEALTKRPAYARAILSSLTATHPEIMGSLLAHQDEMKRIIVAALRGTSPKDVNVADCTEEETNAAFLLRQIWFAGLVGWAGKLFTEEAIVGHVTLAARMMLRPCD